MYYRSSNSVEERKHFFEKSWVVMNGLIAVRCETQRLISDTLADYFSDCEIAVLSPIARNMTLLPFVLTVKSCSRRTSDVLVQRTV